jgi:hypothetical protein
MINTCRICNNSIEVERLEVLPSTVFCSACAHKHNAVKPRLGRMVYSHKTGAEIQIMSPKSFSDTKMYYEANGARSAVKNFSKSVCA